MICNSLVFRIFLSKALKFLRFHNGIAMAGVVNSSYSGQKTAASLDRTKDSSISIADRHGIQLNYFANTQKFTISKTGPYMTFRNGITGELKEKVDTREKANAFLENVHQAIKYLLYANTTVGAQSSRLDTTAANLVTQVTNIKASDSTLRDADMARELTKYVRANVLSESAQAMLAQANVENKNVLGLLQ